MPKRDSVDTESGATASVGSECGIDAASGATFASERGSRLPSGGRSRDAEVDNLQDSSDGKPSAGLAGGSNATEDEVQDLIDAVAGATWNTRNRIMEERFLAALDQGKSKVPAYKPPGETL